jgi:hypothetical protein
MQRDSISALDGFVARNRLPHHLRRQMKRHARLKFETEDNRSVSNTPLSFLFENGLNLVVSPSSSRNVGHSCLTEDGKFRFPSLQDIIRVVPESMHVRIFSHLIYELAQKLSF